MRKLLNSVSLLAVLTVAPIGVASANDKLDQLSKSEDNWVMPGKNYHSDNYSTLTQINTDNVKNLKVAWTFSTGLLNGHEGAPLVVDGKMYIHTSFPNNTFALDLDDPTRILWQDKPKQNAAARAVACCDLVNRGLAYWPGDAKTPPLILKTLLDGHIEALNAKTGELLWKIENSDYKVGSTLTIAPYVVKDKVLVGSSGAELGVRGYVTAYDVHTGEQSWRAYATGPDEDVLLGKDFNGKNPHYGQKGLGTSTWEGDAWKIGGGTNWGWYAYDPGTNLFYYGSGNPAPWNETMRPGDNKWTMTIFGRDIDTGEAKFGYQKTPHDEWDFAGVNFMLLTEQKDKEGKERKLLTHPDRNGIVYTLDRTNGDLISADKIDDTVNCVQDGRSEERPAGSRSGVWHPHGPSRQGYLSFRHGLSQSGPRLLRPDQAAVLPRREPHLHGLGALHASLSRGSVLRRRDAEHVSGPEGRSSEGRGSRPDQGLQLDHRPVQVGEVRALRGLGRHHRHGRQHRVLRNARRLHQGPRQPTTASCSGSSSFPRACSAIRSSITTRAPNTSRSSTASAVGREWASCSTFRTRRPASARWARSSSSPTTRRWAAA